MDRRAVLAIPKAFETSKKTLSLPRQNSFPRPDRRCFRRLGNVKMAPALTAKRALSRRIFHLLRAAMGTPQADLGRRLGHGLGEAGVSSVNSARRTPPYWRCRFLVTDNLGLTGRRFAAGNLRFSDESRSFLNDEARGLQIALKSATSL